MKIIKEFCKRFFWDCIIPILMILGSFVIAITISAILTNLIK